MAEPLLLHAVVDCHSSNVLVTGAGQCRLSKAGVPTTHGFATIVIGGISLRSEIGADGLELPPGVVIRPDVFRAIAGTVERKWAEQLLAEWSATRRTAP